MTIKQNWKHIYKRIKKLKFKEVHRIKSFILWSHVLVSFCSPDITNAISQTIQKLGWKHWLPKNHHTIWPKVKNTPLVKQCLKSLFDLTRKQNWKHICKRKKKFKVHGIKSYFLWSHVLVSFLFFRLYKCHNLNNSKVRVETLIAEKPPHHITKS